MKRKRNKKEDKRQTPLATHEDVRKSGADEVEAWRRGHSEVLRNFRVKNSQVKVPAGCSSYQITVCEPRGFHGVGLPTNTILLGVQVECDRQGRQEYRSRGLRRDDSVLIMKLYVPVVELGSLFTRDSIYGKTGNLKSKLWVLIVRHDIVADRRPSPRTSCIPPLPSVCSRLISVGWMLPEFSSHDGSFMRFRDFIV